MTDRIVVQDIELLMDPTQFTSPDWVTVVGFYPEYCKRVLANEYERQEPYDPQPYLLTVAKELERLKVREGRTADDWMQRLMEHFGLGWMMKAVEDMTLAKQEATGGAP